MYRRDWKTEISLFGLQLLNAVDERRVLPPMVNRKRPLASAVVKRLFLNRNFRGKWLNGQIPLSKQIMEIPSSLFLPQPKKRMRTPPLRPLSLMLEYPGPI
jgi:hypothetical protein